MPRKQEFRTGGFPADRAAWAFANAMQMNPEASIRALLAPDSLTPKEHKSLVDKWFGPGESFGKSLAGFFTNPMTIVGLALTLRYPAPTMTALSELAGTLAPMDKVLPRMLRPFMGANELFYGTGVDDALAFATREINAYQHRYMQPLGEGVVSFVKKTGREPNILEQVHSGLVWDAESGALDKSREFLNDISKMLNKRLDDGKLLPSGLGPRGRLPMLDPSASRVLKPLSNDLEELRQIAKLRSVGPQWGEIESAIESGAVKDSQKKMWRREVLTRMRQRGFDSGLAPYTKEPTQLPDFFPHQRILSKDEVTRMFEDTLAEVQSDKDRFRAALSKASGVTSGSVIQRYNKMVPTIRQLLTAADNGLISPQLAEQAQMVNNLLRENGINWKLPEYDLRMNSVVTHYTDTLSRTVAMTFKRNELYPKGVGEWLSNKAKVWASEGGVRLRRADDLVNNYIPALLGKSTTERYMRGLEWSGLREATSKVLENPTVQNLLGPDVHKRLSNMVQADDPLFTWHGAGAKISQYLFTTTLGFNPGSAAINSLQPLLTTGTIVQPRYLAAGYESAWTGLKKYRQLVKSGISDYEAMKSAFPEFIEQGLDDTPLFREAIEGSLEAGVGSFQTTAEASGGAFGTKWARFRDISLLPFQMAERMNQLATFEASRLQGIAEGLHPFRAAETAAKLTKLTQQWSGPLAAPTLMANWWSPFQQFLRFPAKYGSYLAASGMNYGGIFNPGTLGRGLIASTAAYEAGRAAGVDLSRGLMFGAFPGPSASGPFAPMPVVPPVVAAAGAIGMDLAKGEFKEVPKTLPLLFPGGIEGSRLASLVSPTISRATGRTYADYKNRTPDGRIPLYSPDGQLSTYATPFQLFVKTLGLGSSELTGDQDMVRYISGQKDTIVAYRRMWMEAQANNDMVAAQRISDDYGRRFGVEGIDVTKQDWNAFETRRDMTKLDRVFNSVPADMRGLLQSAAGVATIQGQHMLGTY